MEKVKRKQKELSSLTIVLLWALIQSLGWAVIYLMIGNINISVSQTFIFGFIGLLAGGVTGALQHTLIERGTGINMRHWILLSAVGLSAGLVTIMMFNDYFRFYSPYVIMLPIFVIPAVLQWLSVRRYTRAGFLWIVANAIASIIFVIFVEMLVLQGFGLLSAVVPAGLQGIASGFVMVWLLRKLPSHDTQELDYDNKVKVSA